MISKSTILFVLTLILSITAVAQTGRNYLSIGPSVAFPLNFNERYNVGIGGGLRGYFGVRTGGSLLLNLNVLSFSDKFDDHRDLRLTSFRFGYASPLRPSRVFVYGDVGITSRNRFDDDLAAAIGLGLGYAIPVANGGAVDIVPNFNVAFFRPGNLTWLDLHIAYRFAISGRR